MMVNHADAQPEKPRLVAVHQVLEGREVPVLRTDDKGDLIGTWQGGRGTGGLV